MYLHVAIVSLSLLSCSAQFVDEFQSFEIEECIGEDKFACFSGACILQSQFCDGRMDCDDNTDENFCVDHPPDAALCHATHQFLCSDKKNCIPNYWLCNNYTDCHDGSDEANCTDYVMPVNTTCKGFQCGDGTCISKLWVCDGHYDCVDRSDEYTTDVCHHHEDLLQLRSRCLTIGSNDKYQCADYSYCVPISMMCDGMQDCRDGTDEGDFCKSWPTMCSNYICAGNDSRCYPSRDGPVCLCNNSYMEYDNVTQRCVDLNECELERPLCSHHCVNVMGHLQCECDEGYQIDTFKYLCYAEGPEAMLFFSTPNKIKFLKLRSKLLVTVATGIKESHGVSYDGKYLYWVETAKGHQSIVRAHLEDIDGTKEVLVGLGLEEPGDISIDWLGQNIYFSDAVRGTISACTLSGSHCTTIHTNTKNPKFVTVDPRNGKMYWADFHNHSVIMTARMDGSNPEILVDHLESFGTGLALDVPNERLYYVDGTIKVVTLHERKHVYTLFDELFHRPYSIAVFENIVIWSDWASQTIQTTDKLHSYRGTRNLLLSTKTPVFGMHIYHPALMPDKSNPCMHHSCSHFCFITSATTYVCGCPDDMLLKDNSCYHMEGHRSQYIVVGGGQLFTRVEYNTLGNPESHATHFDIGRVQAMTYDSTRDTLYLYDGQRRSINFINMSDFTLGVTHTLIYQGLDNVLDMDYDYASDALYILDAGRRLIEAVSLRTLQRALVYKFPESEIPISLCVVPDYGKMLVAVVESEQRNTICIDSIGLDGAQRTHIVMNNIKGPHVRLRYAQYMDTVFISDEGNGIIDSMHPEGSGRENYRELSTTVTSLALTEAYVFWTDRRTPRLFWSAIHESSHKIRRVDLSMYPNNTKLLIQATTAPPHPTDPFLDHPCLKSNPCSHVCVQSLAPHSKMAYKCLCASGYVMAFEKCAKMSICGESEFHCEKSNICVEYWRVCDGKKDCEFGEDEPGCATFPTPLKKSLGRLFSWTKELHNWPQRRFPSAIAPIKPVPTSVCDSTEFPCNNTLLCIPRSLMCDKHNDCPDGSDESHMDCDFEHCLDTEFQCASNPCIPQSWKCDGVEDCEDGSDEIHCENKPCEAGFYQCRNRECIELKKRCDGHPDCFDYSDEEDCGEPVIFVEPDLPQCADYEFACELNKSICVPRTAKCNIVVDCPGSTDENNCAQHIRCTRAGMFSCKLDPICRPMRFVCNGIQNCADGSDETPEACFKVNRTSQLYPTLFPKNECHNGYMCANGQCIENKEVCDHMPHCYDGSDEGGLCLTACHDHPCAHDCAPTPHGPKCLCPTGFQLSSNMGMCDDIDECADEVCSQACINIPGTFLCSCHHGYAMRADRRSCKATSGNMIILYVLGNTVRSVSADGYGAVEYSGSKMTTITDLDFNVRKNELYVTSLESGNLIQVNSTLAHDTIVISNVGRPSRVAVEWITGNVYFIDSTPGASCVRVCNVRKKRCAKLQKLPSEATISSLIVDPKSRLMFYCVTRGLESVVWAASLSGHNARDLTTVHNCAGLTADTFLGHLYVAENGPPHIIRMNYTGDEHKKILADHPQLQSPHSLAIFEDHIYYLVANSSRISRCLLFGSKHCETFIYRVFAANSSVAPQENVHTFVIPHESVQRDDIRNDCEGVTCANVCVLGDGGPKCVCEDGSLAKEGVCKLLQKLERPLFNGWSYQEYSAAHQASLTIIAVVIVLLVLYLALFFYYHFVYKPRRARDSAYTEVRFQNNAAGTTLSYVPTVDMASDGSISHEFVNPLQYVRNIMWRQSRKPHRPIGTAGLTIDVSQSPQQNFSDTESDIDEKEKLIKIRK